MKVQCWGPVCIWKSGVVLVLVITNRSGWLLELLTELIKRISEKDKKKSGATNLGSDPPRFPNRSPSWAPSSSKLSKKGGNDYGVRKYFYLFLFLTWTKGSKLQIVHACLIRQRVSYYNREKPDPKILSPRLLLQRGVPVLIIYSSKGSSKQIGDGWLRDRWRPSCWTSSWTLFWTKT